MFQCFQFLSCLFSFSELEVPKSLVALNAVGRKNLIGNFCIREHAEKGARSETIRLGN